MKVIGSAVILVCFVFVAGLAAHVAEWAFMLGWTWMGRWV